VQKESESEREVEIMKEGREIAIDRVIKTPNYSPCLQPMFK
jgi:hypothetical protein